MGLFSLRRIGMALAAAAVLFGLQSAAQARVSVRIDLSSQRMYVSSTQGEYVWPVSTARSGYVTPRGAYAPQRLERMHYSRKYHNSPMPYSIFFNGGYAIHGTGSVGSLGRPASHGCVRLSPAHAAHLYQMVQREGASISITGSPPGRAYAKRAAPRHKMYASHRFHDPYRSASRHEYSGRPGFYGEYDGRARAYAPVRAYRSLRQWQSNPAARW